MSALKDIIKSKGLSYKQVASLMNCPVSYICNDVSREKLSAEKVYKYGRALGVDPATLRSDVYKPGEVTYK